MVCTTSRLPEASNIAIPELLEKGARVDTQDKEGWTVFHWCVWHQSYDALKAIVSASSPEAVAVAQELVEHKLKETPIAMGERLVSEGLALSCPYPPSSVPSLLSPNFILVYAQGAYPRTSCSARASFWKDRRSRLTDNWPNETPLCNNIDNTTRNNTHVTTKSKHLMIQKLQ